MALVINVLPYNMLEINKCIKTNIHDLITGPVNWTEPYLLHYRKQTLSTEMAELQGKYSMFHQIYKLICSILFFYM